MKLSREYIIEKLKDVTVEQLARDIARDAMEQYPAGTKFDMQATIAKFEAMLAPLAPKTIKAVDLARSMGIDVTEVNL